MFTTCDAGTAVSRDRNLAVRRSSGAVVIVLCMADALHIEFDANQTLVVRPSGRLDHELSRVLLRLVATAVATRVSRTHVDFAAVRSCTADAAVAVSGCRRLAQLMPDRVTVSGEL